MELHDRPKNQRVECQVIFDTDLSMIEAVALLYSFQREHDEQGRIVAEGDDRDVALRLLEPSMRTLASGYVTDGARELLQKLQGAHPESDFNSAAAVKLQDDVTDRTVRGRLQELARSGHIEVVGNQKNKRTYRLATPSGTSALNPAASFTNAFQRQDTPSLAFPASDTL